MSCHACGSNLGCAVDCPDAPWNWDHGNTNVFGYLRRLVRWLQGDTPRESFRAGCLLDLSGLKWLGRARRLTPYETVEVNGVEIDA